MTTIAGAPQGGRTPDTRARLDVGDPLRALAALGVVFLHVVGSAVEASGYVGQINTYAHFASLYGFPGYVFDGLNASVSVFFVLSGYLLTRPFLRAYIDDEPMPSIPRYLRNRALRILPAFWVVLVLAWVFHGTRGDSFFEAAGLAGFISSFKTSGMAGVFGQPWSLAVEARFYLLLPVAALVLVALKRRLGRRLPRAARIVLVLVLVAWGFEASADYALGDGPLYGSFAGSAGAFAPGIIIAVLEHVLPAPVRARPWLRWAGPAMFVVGLAMALTWRWYFVEVGPPAWLLRYPIPIATGLVVAGPLVWQWAGGRAWRALDNRVLRWIGARSYSLFLVHSLVIVWLAPYFVAGGYRLTLVLLGAAGLAVSLLASDLLYRFVEVPALRRKAGPAPRALPGPATSDRAVGHVAVASIVAAAAALVVFRHQELGLGREDLLTSATLLGLLAAIAVLPARRAALAALALVAVWVAGYATFAWIPDHIELGMPVSNAVGVAAYNMTSYVDQQVAAAVLLVATIAACIVFAIVSERRAPGTIEAEAAPAAPAPSATRRDVLIACGVVAVLALTLVPSLRAALIDGTRGPLPAGWDFANLTSWDAFQQRGLTPMHDYWYPYGAIWLFADFPTGPVVRWAWQAGLLAVLSWSLWRLVGPRHVRIALCLLAFVAISNFDLPDTLGLPFVSRYLPAVVVAVCYAAAGPLRRGRPTSGHLVFAATCAAVGSMEADILVAGLGGAAFVGLGELLFEPALRTWRTLRAAAVDLLAVAAGLAGMLAFWALTDSLSENASWFTAFRGVSAASASDQTVFGALVGLEPDPSEVTLLVTIQALTLVVACVQRRFGGAAGVASSRLLLCAAGVATVLLAKHLVRPQGVLIALIPLLALLWTAILQWQARAIRPAVAAAIFAGAAIGALQVVQGGAKPSQYLGRAVSSPVRAVQSAGLVLDRGEIRAAGNGRFAAERFNGIGEKAFIADKLPELGGTGDGRFAVLGDAQILYVLFGQDPPGHITLFDASRRSEQRRWIAGVRAMAPKLLVWRRDVFVDGVAYNVRDPLVFAYAIAHYTPQKPGTNVDVLRLRRPFEPPRAAYWSKRLGNGVDLKGIPSYSRGDDLDRCAGGPGCAPYAIVSGRGARTGDVVGVRIAGTPYSVSFATRKGVDSYAIRLDRLWFWPFAKGARSLSTITPGWKVERAGVQAGDDLY